MHGHHRDAPIFQGQFTQQGHTIVRAAVVDKNTFECAAQPLEGFTQGFVEGDNVFAFVIKGNHDGIANRFARIVSCRIHQI